MNFAFLFPGQGAQSVGMLDAYAKKHKEIKATFKEASKVLSQDLFKLASEGPEDELNLTVNTQPVMLSASVALWRVWNSLTDDLPDLMSGHSLGEYSALTCAGVFEFTDAVRIVRKRAELMQAAVSSPRGSMAAIVGLDKERVTGLCKEASGDHLVEPVNFNTATQIVVAGHAAAVKQLIKLAKAADAYRCVPLPVSVPAHSSLLKDAAAEFEEFLAEQPMQPPTVPVLHNTDVEIHEDLDEIRKALALQMHTPVRWFEIIKYISEESFNDLVEIGPGRVLTGLNRHIDRSINAFDTSTPEKMENAINAVEI